MLNKRLNDCAEYYKRLQYYTLVAFLYEKADGEGYIANSQYYYPSYVPKCEKFEKLLQGNGDKSAYECAAEEFTEQYGLNKSYCETLKNSKGFRYMVAVGFHDLPVIAHTFGQDFISLKIDNRNSDFSKPCGIELPTTVKFCGVKKFDLRVEKGDVQSKEIDGLYYDRQEFYCTDDGKILSYITLFSHGKNLVEITLETVCDDISIHGYSHEL
ncbi:MAG: hypothetical protein K2O67_02385 [Clostridia bacterium]|nr:hypothetical protein [Clostridia bacterium]